MSGAISRLGKIGFYAMGLEFIGQKIENEDKIKI